MRGLYQLCKEKYLHWYLAEYGVHYSHRVVHGENDGDGAAYRGTR